MFEKSKKSKARVASVITEITKLLHRSGGPSRPRKFQVVNFREYIKVVLAIRGLPGIELYRLERSKTASVRLYKKGRYERVRKQSPVYIPVIFIAIRFSS